MMILKFQQLQNDVVTLRPIATTDAEAIFQAGNDARIWTYLSATLVTKEAVDAYIEQAIVAREAGTSFTFVIIDNATNTLVGSTSFLAISEAHQHVEIGSTWLTPSVWRTNINTNCKYELLRYCFEELKLHRVQIKTDGNNEQSQRAIERLGATKEGILRQHMVRKDGTVRDTVMYSVIAEQWPNVKQHLQAKLAGV